MTQRSAPRPTPLDRWVAARIAAMGLIECGGGELAADELVRHQLAALRATLAYVKARSPFYAANLADVDPARIVSPDDLGALPTTSADDVRREGERLLCVGLGDVERMVTLPTSGTTGAPKRIAFSRADQELTIDFFEHGMSVLCDGGDRVLILMPGESPGSIGALLRMGLARLGADSLVHGPVGDVDTALDALEAFRATVVVGIPVQVLAMADRSVERGRDIRLKSVLLSTDRLAGPVRQRIADAWGCAVFDHYGTTEMGLGGGVECEAHAGYHLREADLLFEVVDPDSGQPVAVGQTGEVTFTTLSRQAMPLVRYRTGDRARFVPGACACGSRLRLLGPIEGRIDDAIELAPGAVLTLADLDEALLALAGVDDVAARIEAAGPDSGARTSHAGGVGERGEDPRPPSRLVVTLRAGGGAGLEARAAAAIAGIPAVAAARRDGRLTIEVDCARGPWPASTGVQKRRLADEREQKERT